MGYYALRMGRHSRHSWCDTLMLRNVMLAHIAHWSSKDISTLQRDLLPLFKRKGSSTKLESNFLMSVVCIAIPIREPIDPRASIPCKLVHAAFSDHHIICAKGLCCIRRAHRLYKKVYLAPPPVSLVLTSS